MTLRERALVAVCLVTCGTVASAANYPLRFRPSGTVLYVAGYSVDPVTGVTGECNFSDREVTTTQIHANYYQGICNWDLFGNLISSRFTQTQGVPVPAPPHPLLVHGSIITYGSDSAGDFTGQMDGTAGFVYHLNTDGVEPNAAAHLFNGPQLRRLCAPAQPGCAYPRQCRRVDDYAALVGTAVAGRARAPGKADLAIEADRNSRRRRNTRSV